MGERKVSDEQYQADLAAAAAAGAKAATEAMREWDERLKAESPKTAPTPNSEDAFQNSLVLRELAESRALQQHWRAFRTVKGAVGVALVTQSKRHASGRVQKFDAYTLPPNDHMSFGLKTNQTRDGVEVEHEKFKLWKYDEFYRTDANTYVGNDAERLPDVGPARATLAETEQFDVPERIARRDAAFASAQRAADPGIAQDFLPLPPTEPSPASAAKSP